MDLYAALHQMPLLGNSTAVYSDALQISGDVDLARCWSGARPDISSESLKFAKFDGFDLPTWFGQDLQFGISADSSAAGVLTSGPLSSNTNKLVHTNNQQHQQQCVDSTSFNDSVVPQCELFYSDFESLSSPRTVNSPDSSAPSLSSENFYNLEEFLQDSPLSSPAPKNNNNCGGGGGGYSSADSFSIDQFLMDQFELPATNSASPPASVAHFSESEALPNITDLLCGVSSSGLSSPDSGMSSASSVVPESPQSDAQLSPQSYMERTSSPPLATYIQQVSMETNVGSIAFESEPSLGDFSTIDFSVFECEEVMSEESWSGDSLSTDPAPTLPSIPSPAATTKYIPILPKKSLGKCKTTAASRKFRRSEPYPAGVASFVVGVTSGGEVVSEPQPMVPPEPLPKKVKTKEQKLRKKDQNRDAALRYRQKKKSEIDVVTSEADELEERNLSLRGRVGSLRKEIEYLKQLMLDVITARLRSPSDGDGRSCDQGDPSHDDCTEAVIEALQKHA